ncbi:sigma-70-like protein [Ruminiclostridium sufflavum DSM 19573]|uniref:Sigma-70-like protein n=1 Tax=Ruminiclostridium sufflavum DSM 19573 TaxID=1121337 RepID=A0A318XJA4_9FIRM|nr:sigma-70-like protein [Ruminiclostridium sufflavum DSM 19573]
MIERLIESLKLLDTEEYELITALFYEGKSEREYAEQCGISRTTLQYRKYRILEKLKNIL